MKDLSRTQITRLAGLLYLLLIVFGVFSLMYAPSQIMDWESPAQTFENLKGNEVMFKLSIVSGLLMALTFLMLAFVLFKLFYTVNGDHALLLLLFVAISVGLSFSYMIHRLDVLTLLNKSLYLDAFGETNLQSQIMLHFESYGNGIAVNSIFWGLWLLPFGYLVYKSGFLPKSLGVFLILGGLAYLLEFALPLFNESYSDSLLATIIGIPSMIGEFGICLWMLVLGDRVSLKRKPDQ